MFIWGKKKQTRLFVQFQLFGEAPFQNISCLDLSLNVILPVGVEVFVSFCSRRSCRGLSSLAAQQGVTKPRAQGANIVHVLRLTCTTSGAAAVLGTVSSTSWRGRMMRWISWNISNKLFYLSWNSLVPVVYLRRDSNGKVFSPGLAASPDPEDTIMLENSWGQRKYREEVRDLGTSLWQPGLERERENWKCK